MTLGEYIRKIRLERGYSQSFLAKLCGWEERKITPKGRSYEIGQVRISHYENSRATIPLDAAIAICKALDLSLDTLFLDKCSQKSIKSKKTIKR